MKYYLRRITFYVITLFAAISFNFLIPRLMPGDARQMFLQKLLRQGGELTPAMRNSVDAIFGTDDSGMWEQYINYWGNLLQGNFGVSVTRYPAPVMDLIKDALPWTLGLVGMATILSFVIGITLGAWVGWKRGTWADGIIPATTLMQSLPYFWIALILIFFFSVENRVFPIFGGYDVLNYGGGPEFSWPFISSVLFHAILPALTIIISSVGGWLLGMRNMMVSTLAEDYITTAEAKGLRNSRVFLAYATRNAALPSIAGFSISLGFVVAGSIVMEQVFSYPGIGKLMITAVQDKDFALMQGVFLIITITVLAANFIMDLVYGFIDPRARQNV